MVTGVLMTWSLLTAALHPPLVLQQSPPRDPVRATAAVAPTAKEAELATRIAAGHALVDAYVELSGLQEARGAVADAEATLLRARQAEPSAVRVLRALAGFYNRQGQFDKTMEALEAAARAEPNNAASYQLIAVFYWEKASKDQRLTDVQKWTYIHEGIAATDRALAIDPDYTDALTYKNILLRMRANLDTDPAEKQRAIAEADALRNRAIEINKQKAAAGFTGQPGAPLPPPPPPPPAVYDGQAPVRVGGSIKAPVKVRDVRPIYPPDAEQARITGIVILEATIGVDGRVRTAKVLKSVPGLDQAAVDAVNQWEYGVTLLNGQPVPVIMTVTVNFALQ